ncbi:MAG: alanine--glyoxylate aminotransferase family protein [Alphaproteobacteria bacterium]|nr:alanine--glyoxylate aminotransferase family protein [Alphaproteobacteria bacterium]
MTAEAGTQALLALPRGRERVLNMTTGPVEVSPAVATAQLAPLFTPHVGAFWQVHDETVAALKRVLKTRHYAFPLHGSIRTGLDVALANMVRPGARVLAVENGYWGRLIGEWAALYGAEIAWVRGIPLAPIDPDAVAAALRADPGIDLVSIVHVETSSGVVNPIAAIGRAVREHGALYYVDAACSAGAVPYDTDGWHVDIGVTGSHKCLASVPGLAVLTLSDRAYARLAKGEVRPRSNYFDLRRWIATTLERVETPPFTQPTGLILALLAALREIEARGEGRFAAHRDTAIRFMGGVRAAGLGMVLDRGPAHNDREAYSDTVMAVEYPRGTTDAAFRGALFEDHGIAVIGNIGEFAGRSFRVGLMSASQLEPKAVQTTLDAIGAVSRAPRRPGKQ